MVTEWYIKFGETEPTRPFRRKATVASQIERIVQWIRSTSQVNVITVWVSYRSRIVCEQHLNNNKIHQKLKHVSRWMKPLDVISLRSFSSGRFVQQLKAVAEISLDVSGIFFHAFLIHAARKNAHVENEALWKWRTQFNRVKELKFDVLHAMEMDRTFRSVSLSSSYSLCGILLLNFTIKCHSKNTSSNNIRKRTPFFSQLVSFQYYRIDFFPVQRHKMKWIKKRHYVSHFNSCFQSIQSERSSNIKISSSYQTVAQLKNKQF